MTGFWGAVLLLVFCFNTFCFAQVGEGFSSEDAATFKGLAEAVLNDITNSSPGKVNSAVKLLLDLEGNVSDAHKASVCSSSANHLFSAGQDVKTAYYALSTTNLLGCPPASASDTTKTAMTTLLGLSDPSLNELYFAVMLDLESTQGKTLNLGAVKAALADLSNNGLYADDVEGVATISNSWRVLNMLQALLGAFQNDADLEQLAVAHLEYLPTAADDDIADAKLLAGLVSLQPGLKLKSKQTRAIVGDLVALKHTPSVCTAMKVYRAFRAAATLPNAPLVLKLPASTVAYAKAGVSVDVQVQDLLGAPAAVGEVALAHLVSDEGDEDAARRPFAARGADLFSQTLALEPAAYQLDVEVATAAGGKAKFRKRLVVTIPLEVRGVAVGVDAAAAPSGEGEEWRGRFGPGARAAAAAGHWLQVAFDVVDAEGQAFAPHQAFVQLVHAETGLATYFVAAPDGAGRLRAAVRLAEEAPTLMHRSGTYRVALQVGDAVAAAAVGADLGEVELALPAENVKDPPLYKRALLYESDTTLAALPEKQHTFRPPARRGHPALASLFALAVAAAGAVLVGALLAAGGNLRGLAALGAAGAWALAFQGCLGATLLLFALYWLRLTMAACLTYLAPLALATMFVGHRALAALAALGGGGGGKEKVQ